jgi:hypothetical protein
VGIYERGCEEAGGSGAFELSGDAASGGTDVSILYRQRHADGRQRDVDGRIYRAGSEEVSSEERDERNSYETSSARETNLQSKPKEETWEK